MSRTNLLGTLSSHNRPPASWAFSADGRRLILGYGNDETKATAEVWEVVNVRKLAVFERNYPSEVSGVALTRDGLTAFTCDEQAIASVWDVASGRELNRIHAESNAYFAWPCPRMKPAWPWVGTVPSPSGM